MSEKNRMLITLGFNIDEQRELKALQDYLGIKSINPLIKSLIHIYLKEKKVDIHRDKYTPDIVASRTQVSTRRK